MIESLYEEVFCQTYGKDAEQLTSTEAEAIQSSVRMLRRGYRQPVCDSYYEREEARRAYMIAYYPYYIEPARQLVASQVVAALWAQREHYPVLRLAYFAAGPCPELYGTMQALHRTALYDRAEVTVLDAEPGWRPQQELTWRLCQREGLLNTEDICCSVAGCDNQRSCDSCTRAVECRHDLYDETDVYFMQNYLSHVSPDEVQLMIGQLRERLIRAKAGAVFVLIDLDYAVVQDVLQSVCTQLPSRVFVRSTNVWDDAPCAVKYPYPLPSGLKEQVFTGEDGLVPRRWTKYYYAILQKR